MPEALIESLDHEGRGVCHVAGKAVFVDGALPGERIDYASYRVKPRYEQAELVAVKRASAFRVPAPCPHYGTCGGCSTQHLEPAAQVAIKQRVLEDALAHIGRLRPEQLLPPVHGPAWGYRHRARLSVRNVPSKGGVLIGFHERRSSHVADMRGCAVLPPAISDLLPELHALVECLSVKDRLPQIELAIGDALPVLVLRILRAIDGADARRLRAFERAHRVRIWLQPEGPDSASPLDPVECIDLGYELPDFALRLRFRPTDFTQVNPGMNRVLVRHAMRLLAPAPGQRIADLFCGMGNFSLPAARLGARVIGVEGSEALVERARENALANGLGERCEFHAANLFEATEDSLAALGALDGMLIDPPREGAIAVVKALAAEAPRRIVYVSCNPATLARDAAVLVHQKGYRLRQAGVANMFPQTSHVESVALFERA